MLGLIRWSVAPGPAALVAMAVIFLVRIAALAWQIRLPRFEAKRYPPGGPRR